MSITKVFGYNVVLKIGTKTLVGTTSNSFDITPLIKESITKDDAGTKKKTVTGFDFTFSVDAIAEIIASGDEATKIGRDEIIAMVLLGAPVDITYVMAGGDGYSGNVIITGYSEKSDSENEVTYSLNLVSNSVLTKIV